MFILVRQRTHVFIYGEAADARQKIFGVFMARQKMHDREFSECLWCGRGCMTENFGSVYGETEDARQKIFGSVYSW